MRNTKKYDQAFTIVELLVVIVIIGILAAITMVAYSNIQQKATIASLQSDLTNASKQLNLYYIEHSVYPTSLDGNNCPSPSDTNYCLKSSTDNTFTYTSIIPQAFHLTNTKGNSSYSITNNTQPAIATTASGSTIGSACPTGYIPVPGSGTYGTNDFCVMKYEAKADDNGDGTGDTNQTTGSNTWPADTYPISATRKLVSTAAGYPVVRISQTTTITAASSYAANCATGCHLMTEAEWMTIAQNVLSVSTNWDNGAGVHTVGTGYIYNGHNDNVPANAIEADASDANGYTNTGNTSPSGQRRTFTLTNGEVIWDFAGNVWEWTQGTIAGNQQPGLSGESAYAWKQWNNGSLLMNGLPYNSQPASTGIAGITGWSSTQGIGQLYSNYGEAGARAFLRGGTWSNGGDAGVLRLNLGGAPSYSSASVGFRVSR